MLAMLTTAARVSRLRAASLSSSPTVWAPLLMRARGKVRRHSWGVYDTLKDSIEEAR